MLAGYETYDLLSDCHKFSVEFCTFLLSRHLKISLLFRLKFIIIATVEHLFFHKSTIHNWTTDASVCKDSVSMHEAFQNVAFHSNMNPCQITSESKHFHKSTLHSFETERTFKFLFWSGLFCLQECFFLKADCFFFWRWLFPLLKRIVFPRWFFTLLKEAQVNMRIMCGQLTKNVWLKNSA